MRGFKDDSVQGEWLRATMASIVLNSVLAIQIKFVSSEKFIFHSGIEKSANENETT
eukprot:IDg20620t1